MDTQESIHHTTVKDIDHIPSSNIPEIVRDDQVVNDLVQSEVPPLTLQPDFDFEPFDLMADHVDLPSKWQPISNKKNFDTLIKQMADRSSPCQVQKTRENSP